MIVKSECIVLKQIKYGESSLILHLLTPQYGKYSFLINGVRNKKKGARAALFQPGNILTIDFYHSKMKNIWRIKEANLAIVYQTTYQSIVKVAILQYYIEMAINCCQIQGNDDPKLYHFIRNALLELEKSELKNCAQLPIQYLWKLSYYMGFSPNIENEEALVFDLQEGQFVSVRPFHQYYLAGEEVLALRHLLQTATGNFDLSLFPSGVRQNLLNAGHQYFKLHLPSFKEPLSPSIFREIL